MKTSRFRRSFNGLACAATLLVSVSLAPAQNVFVANFDGGNVNAFPPGGGSGSTVFTDTLGDDGLAFDSQGDLFVANYDTGNIFKITPGGTQSVFSPGHDSVDSLAVDSQGDLFLASYSANDIVKITPGGSQSIFASGLNGPESLAFNNSGDLFVGTGNEIVEIAPNETTSVFLSGLSYSVIAMAFDTAGDLYEAESNGNLYEITSKGIQNLFVAGLSKPAGLAFDSAGDLFVALAGNNTIDEYVDNNGALSSTPVVFASGLSYPDALAIPNAVPERSSSMLLAAGAMVFAACSRKKLIPQALA
jgi:sugar lactone lactonase YvrE